MTDDEFYSIIQDVEDGRFVLADKLKLANEKLDTRMCCDGHMCGCYGATYREEYEHYFEKRNAEGFNRYVARGRAL